MASARQIAANRRNAQKSTGPRTPEGRAAVRYNALQHGLCAEHNVMAYEDQAEFTHLLDSLYEEHQPEGYTENSLVAQMAAALWRLRRARRLETAAFNYRLIRYELPERYPESSEHHLAYALEDGCSGLNPFANLSRYEAHHERAFYRALRELQRRRDLASPAPKEPAPRSQPPAPQPVPAAPPASAPASAPHPAAREHVFTKQSQSRNRTPVCLDNAPPPVYPSLTLTGGCDAPWLPRLLPVGDCSCRFP